MRIAIAMIVKNEESCLAKCLDSLKRFENIYILDTGSTDDTVEIARRYTDKIFEDYKWNDSFCEARNHINSIISADWIMSIDADNELEPNGYDKVIKAIDAADKQGFKTVNVKLEHTNGSYHYFPNIYRSSCIWKGNIHNYLNVSENNYSTIRITYGYSEAHKKDPDRAFRILLKEVQDPKKHREMYYLAREYWYRHKYQEALGWYTKYVNGSKFQSEIADAYVMMARCNISMNRYNLARECLMKAININADYAEAMYLMGEITGPNNSAIWHKRAYQATNKNVLFVNDLRNYREKQLIECIPDVYNYKSLLYVGADIHRCHMLKDFRNREQFIDIVEPFEANCNYYKGVNGINNVYQSTIQDFKPNTKYDIVLWWHGPEHMNENEYEKTFKHMETMANKYIIMGVPWGINKQDAIDNNDYEIHRTSTLPEHFEKYGYKTNSIGNKDTWYSNILIWKKIGA